MSDSSILFNEGLNFLKDRRWDDAIHSFQEALKLEPNLLSARYHLGVISCEKQDYELAKVYFNQILAIQPQDPAALHMLAQIAFRVDSQLNLASQYLRMIIRNHPKWSKAYQILGDMYYQVNDPECLNYFKYALNYSPERNKIPGIFLNTLPESASHYVWESLAKGLHLNNHRFSISNQGFFNQKISALGAQRLALGGAISQAHLFSRPGNVKVLKRYFEKIIIHVRDPRQIIFSRLQYLEQPEDQSKFEFALDLRRPFPKDFFERDFTSKADWLIEYDLPDLIQWIEDWLQISQEKEGIDILFTNFHQLYHEPKLFFDNILKFYNLEDIDFQYPSTKQQGELNNEAGPLDKWEHKFNSEQVLKLNQALPDSLKLKFNW